MPSHLHSSLRQEAAAGTAVHSVLTPPSGFWSFLGLPSAWLCLRAKATQQQHSCLVMEPWRPHKASSPAQVMRESFLGLSLHTKPPNHCLAVSTAGSGHCTQPDLCCAVLSRLLAAARAGQVRESIILTVSSTVGVGNRPRGAAPLHKQCFATVLQGETPSQAGSSPFCCCSSRNRRLG